MTEDEFRDKEVLPNLRGFGFVRRIENGIGSDMADLIYCLSQRSGEPGVSGWIELKQAPRWPVRESSVLRFSHFTVGQANWLRDWYTRGCKTCVLAKVGTSYFLMSGTKAKALHAGMTQKEIREESAVMGEGSFPTGRVLLWLTR